MKTLFTVLFSIVSMVAGAQQHFVKVWENNGYGHMNIYALTVKVDGLNVEPGDEIAVYSGNKCVGASIVANTLFTEIIVSMDDGTGNGFTEATPITFKVWSKKLNKESSFITLTYKTDLPFWTVDGKFISGGSMFVDLAAKLTYRLIIDLKAGFNFISINNIPSSLSIPVLFKPLIDAKGLVKIQDETGKAYELKSLTEWMNNIGEFDPKKGYYITTNKDFSLLVDGFKVEYPYTITLKKGWNMVAYPGQTEKDALAFFQPLINSGHLIVVLDEKGGSVEKFLPDWQNLIGTLKPGQGYNVKVNTNCTLIINN